MQVSVLASLHETRVNAADCGLVEIPHVFTELRQKLVCLAPINII